MTKFLDAETMYKHFKKLGLEVRKSLVKGARQQTGDGSEDCEAPLIGVLILTVGENSQMQLVNNCWVNWKFTGWIVHWTVHWSG
eukprot:3465021-Amphidinium_carterae.1